jgi:flavodoxin
MKVLVAYMSKTGNTKKVAQAIFEAIQDDKEIKRIDDVKNLEGFDIAFLGFPIHAEGPDNKTIKLLEKHCTAGRQVALFITHASPEEGQDLPPMLAKFRQAARGANMINMFDCQGELAKTVKLILSLSPSTKYRSWAKQDNSKGQPDQARLERAREFARVTMKKLRDNEWRLPDASIALAHVA